VDDNEFLAGTIVSHLSSGVPVVLASIIASQGSSPRHGGSKMVIAADGEAFGTIGGGINEATTIKESIAAISRGRAEILRFVMAGETALSPDPICGGEATVLLDYVAPAAENVSFFRQLHDAVVAGKDTYLLTVVEGGEGNLKVIGRSTLSPAGELVGSYAWSAPRISLVKDELHNVSSTTVLSLGDISVVVDPIRRTKTLYCFGAGHVASPTAALATIAGFRVVVADDRAEFANTERFPQANAVLVIRDFGRALEGLSIDRDSFIVIVTRGHQHDRVVLQQALKTNAGYIGMIGSRRKRDTIYATLLSQGVSQEQLDRVQCPIGLAIGAETPEEIAVSIVAELIAHRARMRG
jgi:xanthine dehydrogenase accessory factor